MTMREKMARAMQKRAKQPLGNIKSLEPVLVGSLGDAWEVLADAALDALMEPTEVMERAEDESGAFVPSIEAIRAGWQAMIRAAKERQ